MQKRLASIRQIRSQVRAPLTRRSDGIPLPILFDACDVRAAAPAFERNPVD